MATYDEKREKGFVDVGVLLIGIDRDTAYRYCVENRLIMAKCYNEIDEVLFGTDKIPVVIKDIETLGSGYEAEYRVFKILYKREIIFVNGEIDERLRYFAKRDREYKREFTRIYKDIKGKAGGYLGGYTPYGYYNKDKKLYVDDYESFVVKFAFYRYSQGCGYSGIAKELNLRGFRNRNNKRFERGSIEAIIKKKRLYQGYVMYKGEEVKADFRGILEDTEEMLTNEWKNRVFDSATEARITEHRKKYHSENSVPNEIKPYILVSEPKKKNRRDR